MMREYQVRICERLGMKFPGPTRHSRPNWAVCAMSGLPPIATEQRTSLEVRFVPKADDGTIAASGSRPWQCFVARDPPDQACDQTCAIQADRRAWYEYKVGTRLSLRRLRYEHHDLILRRRLFAGLLQALRSIDGTANDRVVDPARKSDVANGDSTAVEPEAHPAGIQNIGTAVRVECAHHCSYGQRRTPV